jgi:hypothetical protein
MSLVETQFIGGSRDGQKIAFEACQQPDMMTLDYPGVDTTTQNDDGGIVFTARPDNYETYVLIHEYRGFD